MKKTVFITFITSLLLLTPTLIKADEEVSKAGTELITLQANVPSSYTVKFPRTVNVTNSEVTFNIDLKGEISSMEKIVLTIPESVTLTETAHDTATARTVNVAVANVKSEFVLEDLTKASYNQEKARTTVTLTHDNIAAGQWAGNLSMVIGLTNRYEEGTRDPE